MKTQYNARVFFAVLLLASSHASAGKKAIPQAPVPSQILSATKVFIANDGADEMLPEEPHFSGDADRAYNQFYAAMKNWNRYQIVSSPGAAEVLLEVEVDIAAFDRTYTPLFRLRIRDPKSNAVLWGFSVHGAFGLGQAESDRNFDQAVARLVADLQALVARSLPQSAGTP